MNAWSPNNGNTPTPPESGVAASPQCPICRTHYVDGETIHCYTCGWNLTPYPLDLVGAAAAELLLAREQSQVLWAREMWERSQIQGQLGQISAQLKRARQERSQLHAQLTQIARDQAQMRLPSGPSLPEAITSSLIQIQQQLASLQTQATAPTPPTPPSRPPLDDDDDEPTLLQLPEDLANQVPGGRAGNPFAGHLPALDPLIDPPADPPRHRRPASRHLPPESAAIRIPAAPASTAIPTAAPSSASIHGDYSRLQALLRDGKWFEADRETTQVMLKVMGREKSSWLRMEDIEKFPPSDLREIDRLWVQYSQQRFGFSVQNKIWQELVKQNQNPVEAWCEFGDRLGWHGNRNLSFTLSAPMGHLPFCSSVGIWWCSGLFPQIVVAASVV